MCCAPLSAACARAGAIRCRLSVGVARRGGASCPPSRPCVRMARTAAVHLSGRPRMSRRLADEQVGPQRSKVCALLNPPFQTRMRRVERPESASKQTPAARDRNLRWHSRSRRVGRPRSFKLRDSPGQPSWGPADDLVLCCAYHLNTVRDTQINLINNRKRMIRHN